MFKTNQPKETMKNKELRKSILDKISKAKTVYVHNGFTEFYFKTIKADLLEIFKKNYKSLSESVKNGSTPKYYLDEYLEEFNTQCSIHEESGDLYFN
jgi:hypothetical protein